LDLITTPVTGDEPHDDSTQPAQALALFYAALNGKDIAMMRRCWSETAESSMDNPLGGISRGWDEIRAVYARLFDAPARYRFVFSDYSMHSLAGCFFVVGREKGFFEKAGQRLELTFRTTRLFRLEQGHWRLLHHHGSCDDPKMLEQYQSLVTAR